jgi:hypothetical protein
MKTTGSAGVLVACLATLWVCGCGGGGGLPAGATGTVGGKVTYNGQPVPAGCVVSFVGPKGITGSGQTDTSGAYTISMRDGSSVLAGSYKVSVSPPQAAPLSDEEAMKRSMEGKPTTETVKEVPDRYRSPESSPLSFEVKAGSNTFDIAMTDK